jgi:hypothetical protein
MGRVRTRRRRRRKASFAIENTQAFANKLGEEEEEEEEGGGEEKEKEKEEEEEGGGGGRASLAIRNTREDSSGTFAIEHARGACNLMYI